MEDAEAIRLTIEGDPRGPEALLGKYQMDVYNAGLRYMGNAADAEDVTQDVFLRAFSRLRQYRPDQPFGAWLHGITRHRSLDLLRSRRPVAELSADTTGAGTDVEDAALAGLESARVRSALRRLASRDRALLVLRYWEDLSVATIAGQMSMTEGGVRVALLRARRTLASELGERGLTGVV
ncbi:MAG: RNA polymerase sigma factor [Candidatus Dormibacteraeota bacterium]|nr:RNA polymerase sigma factor [Candidatus Dormibacteraeota bacterium]